jgi:hypothetical protein
MSESPTGFRPANTLSIVVVIGLALMCICETITFCMSIGEIVDPTRMIRVSDQANSPWLLIQATTGLFQSTIYIATAVTFLIWIFRIYKNLDSLVNQQHREFSAGWAVGWWFVPFANLVKPFQVAREAWFDSSPDIEIEQTFLSASLRTAPTYMGVWWGTWIASNIFSNVAGAYARNMRSLSDLAILGVIFAVATSFSIVAAVLCIKLVRDITSRQEQRFANLQLRDIYDPPPPPIFTPEMA